MGNTHATLSIVIPLYNHERYIDAALDSVMAQTLQPHEIIVVDDGSQDGSLARVRQRAGQDFRIKVWSHPNQGAHYTINAGLQHTTGTCVAILNSDDCYHPRRLAACLQALEQDPEAAAVCTALSFIDEHGKNCHNKWYEEALAFYHQVGDLGLALLNGNFLMTTSNLFIRRSVFDELGYFANLRYAHDLDFFLRLVLHRKKIVLLDEPLLQYRTHATNTISEGVFKVKQEWAAVVAWFAWQLGAEQGWKYLARLTDITDRHNLTRLVFFFFKQFQQTPPEQRTVESWLQDADFCAFLAEAVQ